MKTKLNLNRLFLILLTFVMSAFSQPSQDYLTGYVYNGNQGDESTPISGVTVTLYGSANVGQLGSQIGSITTNGSGFYSLAAPTGYEYYNLVETDPSGYYSVAASSPDGTVVNNNQIRYSVESEPLSDQDKTKNKFWDKPTAPANQNPNAVDDNVTTPENTTITISVLSNDSDPDGDPVSLQSATSASHGTVTKIANHVDYTPNAGYTGTDQFDYTIIDGNGGSDTGTVTVTITKQNGGTASVGDLSWWDLNHNGLQDAGEPGLSNVTVSLFDDQSNLLASTTTDANGHYGFSNLPAGGYYLEFTPPSGYMIVSKDQGTDDTIDSDATPQTGQTATFTLGSGETNVSVDAGLYSTDENTYDFGDAPASYPSASHKLGGPWWGKLGDAPDGESLEQIHLFARGDDDDGNDDEDGLLTGSLVRGKSIWFYLDFVPGESGDVSIGGWIDFNVDGDWADAGESFAPIMIFCGAKPSGGWKHFSTMGWLIPVPANAKTGKTIARFRIEEGQTGPLPVDGQGGAGEVEDHEVEILDEGPGFPPGAVIFGSKWNDVNGDKMWDTNEPPLSGWTIWLDANQNGIEDTGDLYDVTDASGQFMFNGLSAGQYLVGEKMKSGWVQTWPGGAGTHTMDVDPQKPSAGILFGNQQTDPEAGEGAIKWNQPPMFDPSSTDTTCYWGWVEPSIISESYMADDWFCYDPRPVTCIRWWGSYTEWDSIIPPENAPQYFHIGIWTDDPNDEISDFRHPGELIREWFLSRDQVQETPGKSYFYPEVSDKPRTCFQYTFTPDPDGWFQQEGDSNVYWLHIAAAYENSPEIHEWGWLTREHYFHGDAIRIYQPLNSHPDAVFEQGESIASFWDMAFVLGTDEIESGFDFGDAKDVSYGTSIARNGAQHLVNPSVYMGEKIDEEFDGQPHIEAQGDDDDRQDDEDGIALVYPLTIDAVPQVQVQVSTNGFFNAWMDLNQNGQWDIPDEHVIDDAFLHAGTSLLDVAGLSNKGPGLYQARFRFSTESNLWFRGFAIDGEVEDHMIFVDETSMIESMNQMPRQYELYQNYPNPFNPFTTIAYDLPEKSDVEIVIFNLTGQKVTSLVNQEQPPGSYQIRWHGADGSGNPVSTGIYICRLSAGRFERFVKVLCIR